MKIVITDFWPKKAHKYLNMLMISSLADCSEVTVVSVNGFYEEDLKYFEEKGISHIDLNCKEKSGRIGTRIYCIELQKKTKQILQDRKYDVMFCLSYETLALAFWSSVVDVIPTVLCQHSNLDDLHNQIKYFFIKRVILRTRHVVFEEKFKDWVVSRTKISPMALFVINHPITMECSEGLSDQELEYECVGLCHANDDSFIQSILDNKEKYCNEGMRLVLRSSGITSKVEKIEIVSRFLSRDEYRDYIAKSHCVFVATPERYKYRLSGSMYDAFALNKRVITTNKMLSNIYSKEYPGLCNYVRDEEEFFELLKEVIHGCNVSELFDEFKKNHSKEKLDLQIARMIKQLSCEKEKMYDYNTDTI